MKNQYEVEIDGTLYRVTVEEISQSEKSQVAPAPAPAAVPAPAAPASTSGLQVNSPMAGNIFKVLARPGQQVKKGDVIAYVGNSGMSTGPHVHYEVRVNGREVNPMTFMQ